MELIEPADSETPEPSLEDESDKTALISNKVTGEESDGTGDKQVLPERKHMSSIGGASFNFINSIIGSGIIGEIAVLYMYKLSIILYTHTDHVPVVSWLTRLLHF